MKNILQPHQVCIDDDNCDIDGDDDGCDSDSDCKNDDGHDGSNDDGHVGSNDDGGNYDDRHE